MLNLIELEIPSINWYIRIIWFTTTNSEKWLKIVCNKF